MISSATLSACRYLFRQLSISVGYSIKEAQRQFWETPKCPQKIATRQDTLYQRQLSSRNDEKDLQPLHYEQKLERSTVALMTALGGVAGKHGSG